MAPVIGGAEDELSAHFPVARQIPLIFDVDLEGRPSVMLQTAAEAFGAESGPGKVLSNAPTLHAPSGEYRGHGVHVVQRYTGGALMVIEENNRAIRMFEGLQVGLESIEDWWRTFEATALVGNVPQPIVFFVQ